MILVTTWFGTFLLKDGEIVKQKLFPKDAKELAKRMLKLEDWKILNEEKELVKGLEEFRVLEPRLEKIGGLFIPQKIPFLDPQEYEFDRKILQATMIEVAKRKLKRAIGEDDHIAQGVNAIDDLTKSLNVLMERIREWYGLHFPQLARLVDDEKFLDYVAKYGRKDNIPGMEEEEAIGGELSDEDERAIRDMAELGREMRQEKERLEKYVEGRMVSFAPNVAHIVGPVVGARLIELAGGLQELAHMPASTIQLLGAEKALFRHLKSGAKPPKHGVLFQNPFVHQAPYWQRGNIARALASKASIAARADFYSKRFIAEKLKKDLERSIDDIRKKYPSPPVRR